MDYSSPYLVHTVRTMKKDIDWFGSLNVNVNQWKKAQHAFTFNSTRSRVPYSGSLHSTIDAAEDARCAVKANRLPPSEPSVTTLLTTHQLLIVHQQLRMRILNFDMAARTCWHLSPTITPAVHHTTRTTMALMKWTPRPSIKPGSIIAITWTMKVTRTNYPNFWIF